MHMHIYAIRAWLHCSIINCGIAAKCALTSVQGSPPPELCTIEYLSSQIDSISLAAPPGVAFLSRNKEFLVAILHGKTKMFCEFHMHSGCMLP